MVVRAICVLPAILMLGCVVSTSKGSANGSLVNTLGGAVVTPECYSLRYSDPVGSASARLFPIWVMLLPGSAAGSAVGRHHPQVSDQDWAGLSKYSGWKRTPSDSLEIMFTGSFEGIRIHAARTGTHLGGRATWLTDVVGLPEASMVLAGDREQCPQNAAPAT
jgi:hypothetical protein